MRNSPIKAIREKCRDCMCGQIGKIACCPIWRLHLRYQVVYECFVCAVFLLNWSENVSKCYLYNVKAILLK